MQSSDAVSAPVSVQLICQLTESELVDSRAVERGFKNLDFLVIRTSCLNANVRALSGPHSLRNASLIFGIVCLVTLLIFLTRCI